MRNVLTILAATLVLAAMPAFASGTFPDIRLEGPVSPEQRAYLGVGADPLTVSSIQADFVFVEVYSMYCPICQKDAPKVEELYRTVMAERGSERVKFIGIAAGNTRFEVDFYRKKYAVDFPLFEDESFAAHKALDEVGTPAFYLVDLREGARTVRYFHEGAVENLDAMLKEILNIVQ